MANEVELKLTLPSVAVEHFLQDSELTGYQGDPLILDNQYFDSDDLLLNQSHAALRIRKSQHGYQQTLKNKGSSIAGLHVRGEWEYDIPSPELNWDLFPSDIQIDKKVQESIKPLFKTDFTRHVWMIDYNQSLIELVLDQGTISATGRNKPLCEVELELKSGDANDLFTLALQLASRHPLVPCDISKAERGYKLLHPNLSFFTPTDFTQAFKNQQDFSLTEFLQETMLHISRRWDDVCATENWWSLLVLSRQIQALTWIVNQLPMVPQDIQDNLQRLANCMVDLLEPASLVIALYVDENNNSQGLNQRLLSLHQPEMREALKGFIKSNELGISLLQLGQFLYGHKQDIAFKEYLASSLYTLQVSQWQEANKEQMQMLQALAYVFQRLGHPSYESLNHFINQTLVVQAMIKAQQIMGSISDESSRAKLGSWVRRLTVENRTLQDARASLFEELKQ